MATIQHILDNKDKDTLTVEPDTIVYKALEVMAQHDIGALPVVEGSRLRGIFSERDYARKIILKGKSSHDTAISELMTSDLYTVEPDASVESCMELMTEHHIRHLPVLENGHLVGLISIGDVVKEIIAQQESRIQELHDYVTGTSY